MIVWEFISFEYFIEEQWQELLWQFCIGKVIVEKVIKIVIIIVEEVEIWWQERLFFSGFCVFVLVSEFLDVKIFSRVQFDQFKDGKILVKELFEVGFVWILLQGSGCLVGIYLEDLKEKVIIYEVMCWGFFRFSIVMFLLEVQVVIGFLVDFVWN